MKETEMIKDELFTKFTTDSINNRNFLYKVGIYLRISREDGLEISESIKNQEDYTRKYAEENGLMVYEVYSDDGYSGTNFDRPAFNKMINDLKKGKINMIITKDLSRLRKRPY